MWLQKVFSKYITSGFIHSRFESASVKEIQWREKKKELFGEGGRRRIMGKEGKEIVWKERGESCEERGIGRMKGGARERGKGRVKEERRGIRSHLSRVADTTISKRC